MRISDHVTYLTGNGERAAATVTAVTGAGASGWKTLTLHLSDGASVSDVAHHGDAAEGEGYWVFADEAAPSQPAVDALRVEEAELVAPTGPVLEPEHSAE